MPMFDLGIVSGIAGSAAMMSVGIMDNAARTARIKPLLDWVIVTTET